MPEGLRNALREILVMLRQEASRFVVGLLSSSGLGGVIAKWWHVATTFNVNLKPSPDSVLQETLARDQALTQLQNLNLVASVITALVAGGLLALMLRLRSGQGYFPTLEISRVVRWSRLFYIIFVVFAVVASVLLIWDWNAFTQLRLGTLKKADVDWLTTNLILSLAFGLGAGSLIYAGIVFTLAPRQMVVLAAPPLPLARWLFRRLQRF